MGIKTYLGSRSVHTFYVLKCICFGNLVKLLRMAKVSDVCFRYIVIEIVIEAVVRLIVSHSFVFSNV